MIELTFKVTEDDGGQRDLIVRIHEPVRSPPERTSPWAVPVDFDGRRNLVTGEDPLDALESAARHAAILLRTIYGDGLEPFLEPRKIDD
jgi:hypothetical protein